ncbi:hypothetical protein [Neisseria perflava]|uniref:hypothetical protein n=1 Tax=Neisseria perflava TaxID=33053 RepID=UPI00209E375E|nr:hypothetical protein [Neisseria perflava]MCP1659316.1 hypothetical protein [Neisseria perflava]MCP1772880.1 hypothetical protein [Neisseria perflava]
MNIENKEYNAVRERVLKPSAYLAEMKNDRGGNIEKVEFIPPKIGQRGFGKFRVRYKTLVAVEA